MTAVAETNDPAAEGPVDEGRAEESTGRSARLRHLIITVYGLYARHDSGWLSVATLIRLLADIGIGDPAAKIRRWWDLDELERQYEAFIGAHEPALQDRAASGPEAFAGYVRLLTDWRRLPYLDPGLPAELLPDGWIGIRAAGLFFALQARLEEPARAYVESVSPLIHQH